MTTSLIDADSLLVIDVGSITTRAMLFDVVDGKYRFLATGSAVTTAAAPFHDISEGVRNALEHLQKITGRYLIGPDERIIIPCQEDGSGVDTFAMTMSAGAPLKVVAVGLLEDVSLESIRRLATTTYAGAVECISLNDRRKPEKRIDAIVRMRPDLALVAGGTEGGASQSVLSLMEGIGLACYMLPEKQRPEVLFAGNQELKEEIVNTLGRVANLHFAANVRPTLENERLDAAQPQLAAMVRQKRARQINGVAELNELAGGGMLPTATAYGRIIHFLSKAYAGSKGVLGVDIGASATTVAVASENELAMGVYPYLGLGSGLSKLLEQVSLKDISRWLAVDIPDSYLRDYIYNKAIHPGLIPLTQEDLAIEQALARQCLQAAIQRTSSGFPAGLNGSGNGLLPWFKFIMASGSVLTKAPGLANAALMLLDGLQPTGTTNLGLDQNHLASALGVAASLNPILAVQVLDANTFINLGTVISPIGFSQLGTPVLRVKMTDSGGRETAVEVKQGALDVIPLPVGQSATLVVQPLHRYDVGMGGPGRGGRLEVQGGSLGIIIDARGRPLNLSEDPARRRELHKKWLWTLGG